MKKQNKHREQEDAPELDAQPDDAEAAVNAAETTEEQKEPEGAIQQLLRLQADFDNFRKRTTRERADVTRRATEDLMTEMLPVLDHYELGLKTARDQGAEAGIVDGFDLVYSQLVNVLRKAGLEPVDAQGEPFNPHLHEAITHLPSDEVPEDVVMQQTRRGYKLGDKLLRPAQVIVSSGPAANGVEG